MSFLIDPPWLYATGHLYGRVLKSTVFVYDNRPNGGAGTGSLIDRHKRWILTAYHVTPQGAQPMVFFADQDKDGVAGDPSVRAPLNVNLATVCVAVEPERSTARTTLPSVPPGPILAS